MQQLFRHQNINRKANVQQSASSRANLWNFCLNHLVQKLQNNQLVDCGRFNERRRRTTEFVKFVTILLQTKSRISQKCIYLPSEPEKSDKGGRGGGGTTVLRRVWSLSELAGLESDCINHASVSRMILSKIHYAGNPYSSKSPIIRLGLPPRPAQISPVKLWPSISASKWASEYLPIIHQNCSKKTHRELYIVDSYILISGFTHTRQWVNTHLSVGSHKPVSGFTHTQQWVHTHPTVGSYTPVSGLTHTQQWVHAHPLVGSHAHQWVHTHPTVRSYTSISGFIIPIGGFIHIFQRLRTHPSVGSYITIIRPDISNKRHQ